MFKNDKLIPYYAGIGYSVLIGFAFLGIKLCQGAGTQLEILTYRFNFAFLAALIMYVFKMSKSNIRDRNTHGGNLKMLLLAVFTYIVFIVFQVVGMFYTTSVVGAIVLALIPIMVQIIASLILKEKGNLKQNLFICLSVGSVITSVVAGNGIGEVGLLGVAIYVLAALGMAVSNTSVRYVRAKYTPFDVSFVMCAAGFVLCNIASVYTGLKTGTLDQYFEPLKDIEFVAGTAFLGIGCILASSQLVAFALSKLPAINAAIFGNLSTAISIIVGVVIIKEPFSVVQLLCVLCIIIGVAGVSYYGNKK